MSAATGKQAARVEFILFVYPHIALIALGSGAFSLILYRLWKPDPTLVAFACYAFSIAASFGLIIWMQLTDEIPIWAYVVQILLFCAILASFYEANRMQLGGYRGRLETLCFSIVAVMGLGLIGTALFAPERLEPVFIPDQLGQLFVLLRVRGFYTREAPNLIPALVMIGIWLAWTVRHLQFLWYGRHRFETKLMVPLVFFSIASPIHDFGLVSGWWGGIYLSFFTFGIAAMTASMWLVYNLYGHSRELQELNENLEERVEERTRELTGANLHLEEVNALKNDFLAICSHDLKNLLVAVQGYAELLDLGLRGTQNKNELIDYNNEVQQSARRMLDLIKDLLDSARLESGREILHVSRIWLPEVVGEAFGQYRREAEHNGVEYRLQLVEGLPELELDASKMQQAIANLLHNALKFTPKGGSVTCRARPSGAGVEIEIVDTGPGIAAEDQEIIFDKFAIARKRRQQRNTNLGTGLGLSITKRFIELHGGSVRVESELGKGTRFVIYLPGENAAVAEFST